MIIQCAAIAGAVSKAVRERALGKRKLALVTDIPEAVRNDLDLLCRQVGWFCQFCTSINLLILLGQNKCLQNVISTTQAGPGRLV